jgi:iron complex transport system substrate-binding protein
MRLPYISKRLCAVACGVAILIVSGCGGSSRLGGGLKDIPGDRPHWTVKDGLGRDVILPIDIKRAVSLAPSVTENVFAAGAGDRLVGVTTFCNYPEQANVIAKIGDTLNPNMETIVALKPDVVLVSTASQVETFSKTLSDNGIAVYVTDPGSITEVFTDLDRLGELFGTQETAKRVVGDLERRTDAVAAAVAGSSTPAVFVQISKEPLFTIGKGSFLNGLFESAAARSATADVESAFPKLSKETAAALRPDAIVLSESEDNQEPNEVFKDSPAVKSGRVYKINADIISRPGPRLVDALEQIARYLHPEKFR